jgi:hypothetical protein
MLDAWPTPLRTLVPSFIDLYINSDRGIIEKWSFKIMKYLTGSGQGKGLHFTEMTFSRVDLVVGNSAVGKTKPLNSTCDGACLTIQTGFTAGSWALVVEHMERVYRWAIETEINVRGIFSTRLPVPRSAQFVR